MVSNRYNETMRLSSAGIAALRQREGAVLRYYNDAANHCTYGVGTLIHQGPCTETELRRPVSIAEVNTQLAISVQHAENIVRQQVRDQQLTQAQFDALVSFTFNTGARGARTTLNFANQGAFHDVAMQMSRNIYIHPRDANGRRLPPIRLQGLVNRRQEEMAPFLTGRTN